MKYLLLLLLFNNLLFYSQDYYFDYIDYKGDTTKLPVYKNPTVCDCEQVNWKNKEQIKICAYTYDYDFMNEEAKADYDAKLNICKSPSICDCANVSPNNKGLIKSCDEKFNYKGIDQQTLQENIRLLSKCPKKDLQKEKTSICDCLNTTNLSIRKKCNETYFNDSISKEQKTINQNLLMLCIKNQNYKIDVSTCECALFSDTDSEYKKICDQKIEELKQNKRKLTAYLYSLKVCKETDILTKYLEQKNILPDFQYSVCSCNEDELEKDKIEKCNSIWNYKEMTQKQQKAFSNAIKRCKTNNF